MEMVLLDTHVLHWWSAEPERISEPARKTIEEADGLGIAAISWYELAWLGHNGRIALNIPVQSWLDGLRPHVRTLGITSAIADTAAALPRSFPGDPADRLIHATSVEHGLKLVSKDRALREHPLSRPFTIW